MDKKSGAAGRMVAIGATGLLLTGAQYYAYASWTHQSGYAASSMLRARQPLSWIQEAQTACLADQGAYCTTFKDLLATGVEGEGRYKIRQQLRDGAPTGEGTEYVYSLETGEDTFEASAACCSKRTGGEDIWKAGPEGAPAPVVQSSSSEGLAYGAEARAAALLLLFLHVSLLAFTAWTRLKERTVLVRLIGAFAAVAGGVLIPFFLALLLAS